MAKRESQKNFTIVMIRKGTLRVTNEITGHWIDISSYLNRQEFEDFLNGKT